MNNETRNILNNNIHEIIDKFVARENKNSLSNLKACKESLLFIEDHKDDFDDRLVRKHVYNSLQNIDHFALIDYYKSDFSSNDAIKVCDDIVNKNNDYLAYLVAATYDKDVLQEVIDKYMNYIENPKCSEIPGVFTAKSLYTFRVVNGVVPKFPEYKYDKAGYGHIAYKFARTVLDESFERAANKNYNSEISNEGIDFDNKIQDLMNEYHDIQEQKQNLNNREKVLLKEISSTKAKANAVRRKK